jgi:O-antigen/teichoic acid export membrane protein
LSASIPSFESVSAPAPDPNATRFGAGTLSGFAALGAGVLATAVTTPVVVHALGGARFGLWVALVAAVSFTGLLDFGFSQAVARFTGEHRARGDGPAVEAFIMATGAAYLAAFALVLMATVAIGVMLPRFVHVSAVDRDLVLPGSVLVGLATALGLWMAFFGSILHAHQRLPLANLVRAGYWLSFTMLTIAAALAGWGIVGLGAAMASSAALACAAFALLVRRELPGLRIRRPGAVYMRQALRYSLFMFLVSAGAAVVFETDTLVIAIFLGAGAVTAYGIALRVTRGLTMFLHKLPDVLFPFYAGMRARGELARMRENFLLTARLEVAGAAAVVLGLAFGGPTLIAAWVGAANVASTGVFALALTLVAMEAIVHPAAVLAAATGGERRMATINNAEAILNLALSIPLVIRFGVVGVIAGTVLAQTVTNLWFLPGWAMRRLDLSLAAYARATFGPSLVPTACGAVAGLVLAWRGLPLLAAAVSVPVFALVYLRTGAGTEERRWLQGLGPERTAA